MLRLGAYLFAICVMVGVMLGASWALGPRRRGPPDKYPFESGVLPAHGTFVRFASQFYLIAMLFVIFDLEMVFVFAWGVAVRPAGWRGYFGMLAFLGLLLLALVYLWRSGALEWREKKQASPAFFEKKAAKKLSIPVGLGNDGAEAHRNRKFFASFFQKRSSFFPRAKAVRR